MKTTSTGSAPLKVSQDNGEPSVAWDEGCKGYYMGLERIANECVVREDTRAIREAIATSPEAADWDDGWRYAQRSCIGHNERTFGSWF